MGPRHASVKRKILVKDLPPDGLLTFSFWRWYAAIDNETEIETKFKGETAVRVVRCTYSVLVGVPCRQTVQPASGVLGTGWCENFSCLVQSGQRRYHAVRYRVE